MAAFIDLHRASYLKPSVDSNRLNYLSAKYKNIKFLVQPRQQYVVTYTDRANAPGLAFSIYGDRDYWWILCLYNGILNPIDEIAPGTVLRLPSINDINNFLTSQDENITNSTVIV
jgi:hypothetical protein